MAEALFSLCGSGKAHHPCRGTFPGLRRRSAHAADGGGLFANSDFLLCESRIPFRVFLPAAPAVDFSLHSLGNPRSCGSICLRAERGRASAFSLRRLVFQGIFLE